MRLPGNIDPLIFVFGALALSSLGLKAVAGPPRDGFTSATAGAFEQIASANLRAEGFTTRVKRFDYRSALVLAERGRCRVAARNATDGSGLERAFAADVRNVGGVTYLYRGERYARLPELSVRLHRIETEALARIGFRPPTPAVVAFAASPSCGRSDFGLSDVRLQA
jgi:hypothetical protein